MTIELFLLFILFAFAMELIDAGLGMGYGTVLTPIFMLFGYSPFVIVPSILLSQAIGGFTASIFHQKHKNVDFRLNTLNNTLNNGLSSFKNISKDFKIVFSISIFGIIAAIIGVFIAFNIPELLLKFYIGVLVLTIGYILLIKDSFKFSWRKITGIGILASFNKGISGGGFGPVTTGGQIIAGHHYKNAIGCTTLSEVPICITAFIAYILINGLPNLGILIALCLGAVFGAPLGALLTKKMNSKNLRFILGILIMMLGIWTLFKLFV